MSCEHCTCQGCVRERKGDGPFVLGGGVSRPAWMDDDDWAEYKNSAEYAYEVSYVGDEPEPYSDDFDEVDRADFFAEMEQEREERDERGY